MPAILAALIFSILIWLLFKWDRDKELKFSKALWIPYIWLFLACTRALSQWLQLSRPTDVDEFMEGSPVDRTGYLVLLFIGLIIILGRSKKASSILKANFPIMLYMGYCLVSIVW